MSSDNPYAFDQIMHTRFRDKFAKIAHDILTERLQSTKPSTGNEKRPTISHQTILAITRQVLIMIKLLR